MSEGLAFALGAVLGAVVILHLKPANTSTCCQRFAFAVRDAIAEKAGPLEGVVKDSIDALGITQHIPSIFDEFGVPLDGP